MRKFNTLLARELRGYFYSPVAYIVMVFFLIISGVNFSAPIVGVLSYMNGRAFPITVHEAFFNNGLFWFVFILSFPLITMRLFAEEFKLGTIEPLMTAPVRDWQVVLAKFFGALVFYIVLWFPSLLYFGLFQAVTHQSPFGANATIWGTYGLLFFLGAFYVSIGCLASALTKNQIVAAVICFVAIMLLFLLGLAPLFSLEINSSSRQLLGYFSAVEHMRTLSRGEIDTRPLVLYVSMTIVMLTLTHQAFQARKWRL
jgi:ABC-2 type transport system permease protein